MVPKGIRAAHEPVAKPGAKSPAAKKSGRPRSELGTDFARGKILAGAAEVFGNKGIRAVTVEDLLQASDVSRRTFYKCFCDQEDVLEALFAATTEVFASTLVSAIEQPGSPAQKIERCVDAYLGFHRTEGALLRVLQSESRRPDSRLAARRKEVLARIAAALDPAVKRVPGRQVDPLVYETLLVALEGLSVWISDESNGAPQDILRARRVMMRVAVSTLADPLDRTELPPLPLL